MIQYDKYMSDNKWKLYNAITFFPKQVYFVSYEYRIDLDSQLYKLISLVMINFLKVKEW